MNLQYRESTFFSFEEYFGLKKCEIPSRKVKSDFNSFSHNSLISLSRRPTSNPFYFVWQN